MELDSLCREAGSAPGLRNAGEECSGEQRKGGGEDKVDPCLLELHAVADVPWPKAGK